MRGLLTRIGRILLWIAGTVVALGVVAAVIGFFVVRGFVTAPTDQFGNVEDEAKRAGRTVDTMPGAGEPYFAEMDKGLLLKPAEGEPYPDEIMEVAELSGLEPEEVRQAAVRGQNMWIAWTGGNDRFWDWAAANTIGSFDLLKIISSNPSQAYGRDNRFRYLGLINEPCFEKAEGPDEEHFGLWMDQRTGDCPEDPFADAEAYPGVEIGARGDTVPVGSYYGEPTGVLGLRLFSNPDFDEEAAKAWDPLRYYEDETYFNDADLVRPYRVGMSCAFCHVGPNPVNPPADVENPEWSELTSNPGAQYYWVDRVFVWNTRPREDPAVPAPNEANFLFQLFHTNPPGALDTSLVSTDYMNNPRTMNAVYEVLPRLKLAIAQGRETLEGGELNNKQFQDFERTKALSSLFDPATGHVASMRVLKDGADSVGTLGALNRVYLNIGLFSEEWLLHFRPFLGGQKISPIKIADAQENSVFWQATEEQSPDMAIFFLVAARADKLADAPGGQQALAVADDAQVDHGKNVFAENCAACHSSKQPEPDPSSGVDAGICEGGGAGPRYRECWDRYWAWTQTDDYKSQMVEIVQADDFLDGNYLSTERRVPMDLLGTNACTPTATNGLGGDIWGNFTSDTYKSLPPPGPVTVHHPESGGATEFQSLGNGRGYLRPASLISLWSSAPYLGNNSVGYDPDYYAHYGYPGQPEAGDKITDAAEAYGDDTPAAEAVAYTAEDDAEGSSQRAPAADGADAAGYDKISPEAGYEAVESESYSDYHGPRSCPSANPYDPNMPCVENRLNNFEHSIRKMLQPSERRTDGLTTEPVPGYLYRTSAPSCLLIPPGFVPDGIARWTWILSRVAPWAVTPEGGVEVGPFPEGFPINVVVNTQLLPDNDEPDMAGHLWQMAKAGPTLISTVKQLGGQCSPEELADPGVQRHAEEVMRETGFVDTLVGLSKCPDYVVNRGHEFGADLSEDDREALIAYLRHF